MKVLSPVKATERTMTTSDSRANARRSSGPGAASGVAAPGAPAPPRRRAAAGGRLRKAPSAAGRTSSHQPAAPGTDRAAKTSNGAQAKPMFPPSANQLMAECPEPPPSAVRTSRAAAGWYAATPSPDRATAATVAGYPASAPTSATPTPAAAVLSGISHGIGRRSASTPNSGWTTEDSSEAASTMPDAAA
ncbi:hypothetical protein EES37_22785 [Streptomyces sp. ADI91-18]|nr:hypothetical protein EES37_22785 [Streptomyces sp. ADI91-18]